MRLTQQIFFQVRTAVKLVIATILFSIALLFLDRNYRVLPPSLHAYMPQHHHGHVVTDITILQCSSVNPFSSCALDPDVWQRIDKDLYLGKAWVSTAYLYVRRKKEEDLTDGDRVVMDLSVGRLDPSANENVNTDPDEKWESRPCGLWIKRSTSKFASDSDNAITAIDVLFGDDSVEAREGWSIVGTRLLLESSSGIPGSYLTVRRGVPNAVPKPVPRIKDNGKFKIIHISDLHLSTGVGACRDAIPDSYQGRKCEADPRTLDFITRVIDEEKPDLLVFGGDQVNGDTSPDAQTAIFKYAQIAIKRKIPYVSIFGNHDDEQTLSRSAQMSIIESLPYSLSVAGPAEIDGVGNYYIEILARGHSDHSALTLYMLDTHAYSSNEKKYPGYDWIKPNQVDWFKRTATSLKPAHKEYTHIHMDLAFIHIPLPEYIGVRNYWKGAWREYVTAPQYNSGFRDALIEQGIVMVSCGQ